MKKTITAALAAWLAIAAMPTCAQTAAEAFPYPTVPDTLHTPETRAQYVMRHYWDRFDFADTTLLHRPEITEQGFANFADLMPRIAPATAAMGIRTFADRLYATGSDTSKEYFADLVDRYLGQNDSPLHNDVLHTQFLDAMADSKFASAAERTRNQYMARNLRKNMPGSVAADFAYATADGTLHRMHDFQATYTLLYIYDPDCHNCHDTARQLEQTGLFTPDARCRVLAVYPYDDTERWRQTAPHFPPHWTDTYSPGGQLIADDTYYIKQMPAIYLLDSQKRVVLRNPTISTIKETLKQQEHM